VASLVDGRMPLTGGAMSYTKAGTGPAVLLIHGLGGTRGTWRHLIPGLARTHTVIAPDLPGHGGSDPPAGDYSLGAHACAMRDLLLTLGYPRASIVGHSLGGGVALQVAYQFPERTERIVLISSGGLGAEVTPMLRAATLPGADKVVAGLSTIPAALTQRLFGVLPGLIGRSDARVLAELLRGLTDEHQRRAFLRTACTVIDWRGQTVSADRQLSLLSEVPLLVAWGAEDKTIPPRHHHALAERVPHAVTVEIADAGHYPHETAPTQVLSALQTFLAATQPFRYIEDRFVQLLTRAAPVECCPPAARSAPGHPSSPDHLVRH
jgi:pimeloyl-ACP methyl ester carboxylesterase